MLQKCFGSMTCQNMRVAVFVVCLFGLAASIEDDWYESHIDKLSDWSVEACTHIMTERAKAPSQTELCASFVSEHGKEMMQARAKALSGVDAQALSAADLCAEVVHILSPIKDEEIAHIPTKMPYLQFCKNHFGLESDSNQYLGQLKHYFVLNKRAEREEQQHEEL